MFAAYLETLAAPLERFAPARSPDAAAAAADLTAQNLQARVRGAILMALSNRQDRLLLTTGNKSEVATGYCTLYGDMAGGLAVISDVPKTLVYRLARAVNADASPAGHPADPRVDADQAAVGRAAARSDRPGQPAALRPARRHPGGAPRRGAGRGGAGRARLRRRRRRRRASPRAHQRIQAPPDAARPQDHGQGLRSGPPLSDRPRARIDARRFVRNSGSSPKGLALRQNIACMVRGPRGGGRQRKHASCHYRFAR